MIATRSSTHPDYDSDAGTVSSLETPAMSHRSSQQKLTAKGEEKKAKAKCKVKTSHTRKTHPTQSHVKANGTTTAKAKLLPKAESDDESAQSSQKVAVSAKGPAVSASSKAHHLPLSSYSRKVRRDMLQGISATHENDVDESWKSLPRNRKTCRTKNDGDESWSSPTDMEPPTPEESDVESTQKNIIDIHAYAPSTS